jgi:deazaflavin-dependent oxidoreductase (nitroreductase family)
MVKALRNVRPPRGLSRTLYRLPIWFYRLRLGMLFGKRFLLLKHTGRVSGLHRYAVLEIIRADVDGDFYYVLSAFGEQSDWVLNIQHQPNVEITVGARRIPSLAEIVSVDESERELLDYARRHPVAARLLPRLIGYQVDGSEAGYRALASVLRVIRFQPRAGENVGDG